MQSFCTKNTTSILKSYPLYQSLRSEGSHPPRPNSLKLGVKRREKILASSHGVMAT